ncbi:ImmA/IrrE family metallo-endopeptidase [Thermogemmatispora tikiterensis]|uniref:IrrE N-terminal-like domain-containing protein n=1 Tax=Thermogemmatispora tikiterensis TaxID=1825093 RepID=A0A328VI51_9CHLR|nr:ImmA/IrrE family metallo-endopeptidase [Thermogemmatispora tikiterensis]RAQ93965.1 hypothetical protein A4R35_00375 [Thermogemmatispora tikiterensis]
MQDFCTERVMQLIDELYASSQVEPPTLRYPIAPLGEIIDASNLLCIELADLTRTTALRYLFTQGGLLEVPVDEDQEPLAGFIHAGSRYGCIFVERRDLLVRRRFSAAHELGHYLLHFRPALQEAERRHHHVEISERLPLAGSETSATISVLAGDINDLAPLPPRWQMEREANIFATLLLMPEEIVRGLAARLPLWSSEADFVSALATCLLVSDQAMQLRLKELQLLPLPRRVAKGFTTTS